MSKYLLVGFLMPASVCCSLWGSAGGSGGISDMAVFSLLKATVPVVPLVVGYWRFKGLKAWYASLV